MARYIDADALLKKIWYGNSDSIVLRSYAAELVKAMPTADVVPRAEMEKLQKVIFLKEDLMQKIAEERNKYSDELESAKDTNEHLAVMLMEAKSEVAMEIFERLHAHRKFDGHTLSVWSDDLVCIAKEFGIDLEQYDALRKKTEV